MTMHLHRQAGQATAHNIDPGQWLHNPKKYGSGMRMGSASCLLQCLLARASDNRGESCAEGNHLHLIQCQHSEGSQCTRPSSLCTEGR